MVKLTQRQDSRHECLAEAQGQDSEPRDLGRCPAEPGHHTAHVMFSLAPTAPGPSSWPNSELGARNLVGQRSFLTDHVSGQQWVENVVWPGGMDLGLTEGGG